MAQLELISQTTVAISPAGGVSMLLPFLPSGAHAVLVGYMLGEKEPARHGECQGGWWCVGDMGRWREAWV